MRLYLIYILSTLILFTSCNTIKRQEALDVITQADSMYAVGKLYRDTALLKSAIFTLEHSSIHDHNELAHAYYYLGRNYDVLHMDTKEVPCFLRCIELKPTNKSYLGKAYINLRSICLHSGETDLAIYLTQKGLKEFLRAKDSLTWLKGEIYYANILINYKGHYLEGMEELKKVSPFLSIDNSLLIEHNITLSSYYCLNHYYDSALHILNSTKDLIIDNSYQECRLLLQFCEVYEHFKNWNALDSCFNAILNITDNSYYLSLACNYHLKFDSCLENNNHNLNKVFKIKDNESIDNAEESKAAIMIKEYYASKMKNNRKLLILIILIFTMICGFCLFFIQNKKKQLAENKILQNNIDILTSQNETMRTSVQQEYNKKRKMFIKKRCEEYLNNISYFNWKDYKKFKQSVNVEFYDLADKLELIYNLNEKEVKLCVMVMIGFSRNLIAENLYMAENSIGKTKLRIAKKLNTTMAKLPEELISIASE